MKAKKYNSFYPHNGKSSGIILRESDQTDIPETKQCAPASSRKGTFFFVKGIIFALICIVLLIIVMIVMAMPGSSPGSGTIVPAQECAENTVGYVNNYLVNPGTAASLVSVREMSGLYEITISYQSRTIPLYTSRDCSRLFTSSIDMNAARPKVTVAAPVKSARPAVDLYIMSFCPYGTQAETVMRPVVDLLGDKADFRVRYITDVSGETIETVSSLHGPAEVRENAFQLCIIRNNPAVFWEYLRIFNDQCYPQWQNSGALDACRKNVTAALMIDHAVITDCASGSDAIVLLKADDADSEKYAAYSSPTLLVNGVEYNGARTPEAYKQFICNSFETAPGECSTPLSSASATGTTGGCG